jgi:hypothetical protein
MQDPEQIRRFTRGVAMMKDPPWLPIAAWMAVVPVLVQLEVIARSWLWYLLGVAAVATALGSRWFKRTYGVVKPSPDSFPERMGAGAGGVLRVAAVFFGLELLAGAIRLPVSLGWAAAGAYLAWAARASLGVRSHLYLLAAICVGLAFLPLVSDVAGRRSLPNSMNETIILSAFGVGWVYVCIQDYRAIRRNLRNVQG